MTHISRRRARLGAAVIGGLLTIACIPGVAAQAVGPDSLTLAALHRTPTEVVLAGGSLRLFNLYARQADAMFASGDTAPDARTARMLREAYDPYASLWAGYFGDRTTVGAWIHDELLPNRHQFVRRLTALTALRIDTLFASVSGWLETATGLEPRGEWYLLIGSGATDAGGLSDGRMVMDFTNLNPASADLPYLLAHELTHQVHGLRPSDPDAGTVLNRIITEGLATYAAFAYADGRRSPAQSLGYTEIEWEFARAHEDELRRMVEPLLGSVRREDLDRIASRSSQLLPDAPGAIGYFLGFRAVQAYAEARGGEHWVDIVHLPVREALHRSGYALTPPPGTTGSSTAPQ